MKFFEELNYLFTETINTGKKIWYFIIIANLGFAFFFFNKGYADLSGLLIQSIFISIFIPVIITLKKEFGS